MRTLDAARLLRRIETEAERQLWVALRDRRFAGMKFRRQHPVGSFIADFYCPKARLIVEVDGAIHRKPEQVAHDELRDRVFASLKLRVLRVTNDDVLFNLKDVLHRIGEACAGQSIKRQAARTRSA